MALLHGRAGGTQGGSKCGVRPRRAVRGEASNIALRLATLDAEGDRCIITSEEEFKERLAASSEGSYTRFHAWVSHGKDQGHRKITEGSSRRSLATARGARAGAGTRGPDGYSTLS
jgi:hypothetical protein